MLGSTSESQTYWTATYLISVIGSSVQYIHSAHPELIGQTVVLATEGGGHSSPCDRYPELIAGWLPPTRIWGSERGPVSIQGEGP